MTISAPAAHAMLYRWRLKPGREAAFVAAWSEVTRALRAGGSLGSRLHRGDDGCGYGYARWPDAGSREQAFAAGVADAARTRMQAAIAESLPAVRLQPVADYLLPMAGGEEA